MNQNTIKLNSIKALITSTLILVTIFISVEAHSYCTNSRQWPGNSPIIDVYVVTSGIYDVDGTGFSSQTVTSYTKAAIQQFNEASGVNVRLRYAGVQNNPDHSNDGITIYSTTCGSQACGSSWVGCAFGNVPNTKIALYPTGCSSNNVTWSVSPESGGGTELQGVIAHELGHAIGLGHSDEVCATSQNKNTRGIMRSWATESAMFRWLRRDDIAGLRAKYGTKNRTIRYRTSPDGQSWSNENVISGKNALTPVNSTNANGTDDRWLHGVTWADNNNRVTLLTGDWLGWYNNGNNVTVDSSVHGRTWAPPTVAHGNGKIMVAWLSNENVISYDMTIRWAMRAIGTGSTTFTTFRNGPITSAKTIGLEYEGDRNVFLLTYLTIYGQGQVLTIDASTGLQISDVAIGEALHGVGPSACIPNSNGSCITPISTSGINGPCLGWYKGAVSSSEIWQKQARSIDCYYSFGLNSLAYDARISSVGFVGSFTNNSAYGFLYQLPLFGSNATNVQSFYSNYWPWGVGAMTNQNSQVQFRAYTAY